MKKRMQLLLACAPLLAGAPVSAQSSPHAAAAEAQAGPEAELAATIKRFNDKNREVGKAYNAATTDAERSKILADRPGKNFIPDFRAIAEKAAGTDTAAKAWMWVLRLNEGDQKLAREVIEILLGDHMQSEAIAELPNHLRYAVEEPQAVEALRAMIAESPHDKVRAASLFTLGGLLLESGEKSARDEGRDCMEAVVAEYGDVAYGASSTYRAAAEGFLYELDKLQIGMAAPDFETVDENGAPWKLSDYRGKVVVVDFWGFW